MRTHRLPLGSLACGRLAKAGRAATASLAKAGKAATASLLVAAASLSACGTTAPTWSTWYSGSCDSTFEMPGQPVTGREDTKQPTGDLSLTVHRLDAAKTTYVYSCRTFPQAYLVGRGEGGMADEVLDHELQGFDAGWHATRRVVNAITRAAELTGPDGGTADIHVIGVANPVETHATLTIGVGLALTKRFVAGITIGTPPSKEPVRVKSAECLSSIVMPNNPRGVYAPSVVSHVLEIAAVQQIYTLRCVFMDESMRKRTPAELFHQSLTDTEQDGQWKARDAKDLELDGRHAREQLYVSSDNTRQLRVRIAVDGERLQIAAFTGLIDADRVARSFLDSFRLLQAR